MVILTALPCHFYLAWQDEHWRGFCLAALIGGTLLSVLLGVVATRLPMRLGLRAFRKMEM